MKSINDNINKYLADVADLLRRYGCFMTGIGLTYGKMGVALFLYRYARSVNKSELTEYADEMLSEVIDDISRNTSLDYDYGLSGIGVAISYLLNNKYLDSESEIILSQLDDLIMNRSDNISDLYTLISIACYWNTRRASEQLEILMSKIHSMCKNRIILENVPTKQQEMMRSPTLFYVMNTIILDKKNMVVSDRKIVDYLNSPKISKCINASRWCDKFIYKHYINDTIISPSQDDITFRDIITLSLKKMEFGISIPKNAYFEKIQEIMLDVNLLKQLIDLANIQSLGLGYNMSGLAWALLEYREFKY